MKSPSSTSLTTFSLTSELCTPYTLKTGTINSRGWVILGSAGAVLCIVGWVCSNFTLGSQDSLSLLGHALLPLAEVVHLDIFPEQCCLGDRLFTSLSVPRSSYVIIVL